MRRCSRLRASLSACASSSPSNSSICSSSVGSWPWPRRLRFRGGEGPPSGSGVGGCFPPRRRGTLPGRGLGARVTAFLALLRGMLRCESKTSRDCPVTLSSNGVPRVAEGCRANQKPHIDWPKYILSFFLQNVSDYYVKMVFYGLRTAPFRKCKNLTSACTTYVCETVAKAKAMCTMSRLTLPFRPPCMGRTPKYYTQADRKVANRAIQLKYRLSKRCATIFLPGFELLSDLVLQRAGRAPSRTSLAPCSQNSGLHHRTHPWRASAPSARASP